MPYTKPQDVTSPQVSISNLQVVCDQGQWDYAVALFEWDHVPRVGIRWNGGTGDDGKLRPGNPQSRGLPTWFALPRKFEVAILQTLIEQDLIGGGDTDKRKADTWVRQALADREAPAAKAMGNELETAVLAVIKKLKAAGEL